MNEHQGQLNIQEKSLMGTMRPKQIEEVKEYGGRGRCRENSKNTTNN